ncbi:hypothetical protein EV360DRAFT_74105 [Lentinula raphanica]|nr:hypothetical protein EV360DRAFT_74105 [Lentinula raphanica]
MPTNPSRTTIWFQLGSSPPSLPMSSYSGRILARLRTLLSLASVICSFGSAVAVYNATSVPPMTLTLAVIAAMASAILLIISGEFNKLIDLAGAYPSSLGSAEGQSRITVFAGAKDFDIRGATFNFSDTVNAAYPASFRTRFRPSTTSTEDGQSSNVEDTEAE